MHEQYKDRVQFLGVAGRDDLGAVNDFIANLGVGGMVHAFDEDGSIWSEYGVLSQPSFAFIDAEGNSSVQFGRHGEDSLIEALEAIL